MGKEKIDATLIYEVTNKANLTSILILCLAVRRFWQLRLNWKI